MPAADPDAPTEAGAGGGAGFVGLEDSARALGVHYMTAYRYVRTGVLPAERRSGRWLVRAEDLKRLKHQSSQAVRRSGGSLRGRRERLAGRLMAGDGTGCWAIVESALSGGASPADIYLQLLSPALAQIGKEWAAGRATIDQEHRATAIAVRIAGRLGPRFDRPGRRRAGTVVLGAAPGDRHQLPVTMVADLSRAAGLSVVDLGADVPEEVFLTAAGAPDLVAVGVSISVDDARAAAAAVVAAVRDAHPDALILAGGPAVAGLDAALALGAHSWEPDAVAAASQLRAAAHRARVV